jgi:hypothetical protein
MTTTSGAPLITPPFASKPTLIPQLDADGIWNGKIVKIEQVLFRSLEGGARLHVWLMPDPRPHNHPWAYIDCVVIRGGYTAIEYIPDGKNNGSSYDECEVTLGPGDCDHRLYHFVHHQIVSVEPGTISIMTFGPVVGDGKQWGHLKKTEEGLYCYEIAKPMGGFVSALWHCNPHLRPEGWNDPYASEPIPVLQDLLASVGLG